MGKKNVQVTRKLFRIQKARPATPNAMQPVGKTIAHPYQISLILPTKDRFRGLVDVLDSIAPAMDDLKYEIILIADKKCNEIQDIIKRYGVGKVFFDSDIFENQEDFSWPGLMNHGFARAEGQWVMFGSDDIVFHPYCFKNALCTAENLSGRSIGGISFLHKNTIETYDGFFKDYGYDTLNGDKTYINFGLINADAFAETSGFDQDLKFFWADVDICLQLWACGFEVAACHASLVDHHNALEAVKKESRTNLFLSDTRTFFAKWDDTPLFGGKSPLEKIRFVIHHEQARSITNIPHASEPKTAGPGGASPRHLVIDGVIFQLQAGCLQGISRVWRNLIPELNRLLGDVRITVVQRGGFEVPVSDVAIHPIGQYKFGDSHVLDQDDELLGATCKQLDADLFVSTYYTRAPGVTNIVFIHDLIPEILKYDLSQTEWLAKQRVIETADAFVTVSKATRNDLIRHYPQTIRRPMLVAPNGLDEQFRPVEPCEVESIRRKMKLAKPYFLLVGRRHGYKNGARVLTSLAAMPAGQDFTILCVGGERHLSEAEKNYQHTLDLRFAGQISDADLNMLYCGAEALFVPSQFEGFGLPVIEAMACACPVVAHPSNAVIEIGGDAVIYADFSSPEDLGRSLAVIGDPARRKALTVKGVQRAARFRWPHAAGQVGGLINEIYERPSILLTALVSTYNAAEFISGCLDDLESQTLASRLEIVVVDSASEQDEAAIVGDFQRRYGNIKYLRTSNRENVYKAWNRGIKFALGKYITNANTDDRHRRDALAQMVDVLERRPEVALVYADVLKTQTANETFDNCAPTGMYRWHDWHRETLLEKGCFIGPQPVWRRKVHDVYGYFDERYATSGDFEFWLRISQTNEFHHISKTLGLYMDRPDSIEHRNTLRKIREDDKIIKKYRTAALQGRIIERLPAAGAPVSKHHATNASETCRPIPGTSYRRQAGADEITQGGKIMNSPETILNAIECLSHSGHGEAAAWAMDKMQMDFPDAPEHLDRMAAKAYEQGDMGRARACFEKAAAMAPRQAAIQKNLGDFYYVVQKEAEKALGQYVKVLEIEPRHVDTLMLAGHVSISLHRYPEARAYYRQALSVDPANAMAREFLEKMGQADSEPAKEKVSVDELYAGALAHAQNENRSAAMAMLEQVLEQDLSHAPAHNDLGVLNYEIGNMEPARRHYEKAAELMPESETFQKNLADFYWVELGDPLKAMERYLRVLKLAPQDIGTLLSCGQICLSLQKPEDARDFFDTALTLEPWNEDARQMLRQLDDASPVAGPAWSEDDLYGQARAMTEAGDMEGAIDHLKLILTQSPGSAKAHNDLGVLYYETGQMDEAESSYRQAVQLDPKAPDYRKNLADFYLFERGMAQEAMKMYLQILEGDPEDVEALNAVGVVCTSLGQLDNARHFHHRVLEIEPWNEFAQNALSQMSINSPEETGEFADNAAAG